MDRIGRARSAGQAPGLGKRPATSEGVDGVAGLGAEEKRPSTSALVARQSISRFCRPAEIISSAALRLVM
jgi:hypothetical protein